MTQQDDTQTGDDLLETDFGYREFDGAEEPGERLHIDVEGFEGPLDLLLTLARNQKVDVTKISILGLAEQYLEFITQARSLKLELAADYLVMAAWLAYLKSRLLLPETDDSEEPSGEELAAHLTFRLQRLEAMRQAGANLMARNRLDRDFFARGDPEQIIINTKNEYADNLYDLLTAYAQRRQKTAVTSIEFRQLPVLTIHEAREQLVDAIAKIDNWTAIDGLMHQFPEQSGLVRSLVASTFSASLELVREGVAELQQEATFTPVYIRRAAAATHRLDQSANLGVTS